jgi:hypothetical protein
MPDIIKTDQITVLEAFRDRIRSLSGFGPENVWITDQPPHSVEEFEHANRHKLFVVVFPLEGSPDGPYFVGGGANSLIENTGASTIIYSTDRLSRKGQAGHALSRTDIGLFTVKQRILKELHGTWLVNGSGKSLVTQLMECVHAERPTVDGQPMGDLALTWALPFHWDLD